MSLTKLRLGIYLAVWGSDLPVRQHAQASRPGFREGRCMPAVSLFSQEPIRIPIAPRPRARLWFVVADGDPPRRLLRRDMRRPARIADPTGGLP